MAEQRYLPIPKVAQDASLREISEVMVNSGSYIVEVVSPTGESRGWIDALELLKSLNRQTELESEKGTLKAQDLCRPWEAKDHLDPDIESEALGDWYVRTEHLLPRFISPEKGISGVLAPRQIMAEILGIKESETQKRLTAEKAYQDLSERIPLGIALVDSQGNLHHANALAQSIIHSLGFSAKELRELGSSGSPRVVKLDGRHYRVTGRCLGTEHVPASETDRFLITFVDVTGEYRLLELLRNAREEAELALAVMLPDQRIATRLQSIVEYTDTYDGSTGRILITGVISQGVYRHVINILKLIADAFRQGLMELPGIEKEALVTAAIFHDLAKVQPELKVGDVVLPEEVFEPGYLHAFRGAALAEGVYCLSPQVVNIIKFHHHEEKELPADFPPHLLPMYRLFRLIDGLSAGITRRSAQVKLTVKGSKLVIEEHNPVPSYNRSFVFDLYTGNKMELAS